jgi:FkbM family methyltransferase
VLKKIFTSILAVQAFWNEPPETIEVFGAPFLIPAHSKLLFYETYREIVEKNQYHAELIKSGDIVVDAGANLGIFSVYVASKHPDATIYAFEPTPTTFSALKYNTKSFLNVHVFNFALGDREGIVPLVETPVWSGGNFLVGSNPVPEKNDIIRKIYRKIKNKIYSVSVKVKTLDNFCFACNFLKIDTEGYEANILKGASETIKKYKPIIAMSAYHKPEDRTELPRILNSIAPYDCELRHDCEEDFICKPK